MKTKVFAFAVISLAISLATAISSAQRRTDNDQPIRGDFKITIKTTMSGQDMQSTTMIKGLRERSETSYGGMNMGMVSVTQCDLKRTIQINYRARKYMIKPMEMDDSSSSPSSEAGMSSSAGLGSPRRGGVVTMTTNTIDTGERKEMFGFTARHLKRTMTSSSSPDACQSQQMKMKTDGWYINLEYGLNCGPTRPPQMGNRQAPQGCQDRYQFKRTGPVNLGYPLVETMTM